MRRLRGQEQKTTGAPSSAKVPRVHAGGACRHRYHAIWTWEYERAGYVARPKIITLTRNRSVTFSVVVH